MKEQENENTPERAQASEQINAVRRSCAITEITWQQKGHMISLANQNDYSGLYEFIKTVLLDAQSLDMLFNSLSLEEDVIKSNIELYSMICEIAKNIESTIGLDDFSFRGTIRYGTLEQLLHNFA